MEENGCPVRKTSRALARRAAMGRARSRSPVSSPCSGNPNSVRKAELAEQNDRLEETTAVATGSEVTISWK
jgi:hypothetical protein